MVGVAPRINNLRGRSDTRQASRQKTHGSANAAAEHRQRAGDVTRCRWPRIVIDTALCWAGGIGLIHEYTHWTFSLFLNDALGGVKCTVRRNNLEDLIVQTFLVRGYR